MKAKILLIPILSLIICGCAAWQLVQIPYKWRYSNFEATLPEGWMKFNSPVDLLFLTKDGEFLQNIRFFRYRIDKEKELPLSKKKFMKEMLPQEIAELIVNEMSLDKNKNNLKILENTPVSISGTEGFRLQYVFNTPEHLKLKSIDYGFKYDKYIYLIRYQAAEQFYFDKDIEAFNGLIDGFKIF
jgi:hypothetical protein